MNLILGVDPGSVSTGFGLVVGEGNNIRYVSSGAISLGRGAHRFDRLGEIYRRLSEVIAEHSPTHFAIEEVFYNRNPKTTLVLGEARGVAIAAAASSGLPIYEYSARTVKQSVTGNGAAHKSQVNFMLGKLLSLKPPPENEDESDAIAVAICHAFKAFDWTAA